MIGLRGEYEFYQGGKVVGDKVVGGKLVYHFSNIVCTPVYEYMLKSLNYSKELEEGTPPGVSDIDVSYFAFGTGTTGVTEADTLLETEYFRKYVTSKDKSLSGKQFVAICQLATSEANFTITEVGVFSGGSATPDTGTLLSHALKSIVKNSNITYNIIYRLTLEEV